MDVSEIQRTVSAMASELLKSLQRFETKYGVAAAVALAVALVYSRQSRKATVVIPRVYGFPFLGSWSFIHHRTTFVEDGLKRFGGKFQFKILWRNVYVFTGEEYRKRFFGDNNPMGYSVLLPVVPNYKGAKTEEVHDDTKFVKPFAAILRKERLDVTMPKIFADLEREMKKFSKSGRIDPFEDIYNLVFPLTCRMTASREIADNPEIITEIAQLLWVMEAGANAKAVFLPWAPNAPVKRRNEAMGKLFFLLLNLVTPRLKGEAKEDDSLQVLIDMGWSSPDIIKFIIGSLFAGIRSTGITVCWLLMYLDAHRNWKQKVQAEVASFLSKYTNNLAGTLASQLAEVPVTAWEEEMPALDACIKETQRLVQCNIAMREITSERGEFFQGHHFKKGDCLLYPFSDVHMNPELYKDPAKFDPGRYNGRDDPRSQKFSFIGWGAGRHPCLGMRFAKLEIKAIISLFLTGYDYKMVDVNGERLKTFPRADRDDISKTVPLGGPVYFEYSRTEK